MVIENLIKQAKFFLWTILAPQTFCEKILIVEILINFHQSLFGHKKYRLKPNKKEDIASHFTSMIKLLNI